MGILGVIAEVSIKVLPRPVSHHTLSFEMTDVAAMYKLNEWAGRPLPVSASVWHDGALYLRLAGASAAVNTARHQLGGETIDNYQADAFWTSIREQTHPFFDDDAPLWRVSVPSTAPALSINEPSLIEWSGALRWLRTRRTAEQVRECAKQAGGHATLFRGGERAAGAFTPLSAPLAAIHRRLKAQFDPANIFNRGRLYPDL
jgi:glycolate oxidase FAD binding subunit